jgi:hypothetical protein
MKHARNSPTEPAPLRLALIAQLGGAAGVLLFIVGLGLLSTVDFWRIPFLLALMQGGIAASLAMRLRSPRWWIPIHLAFMPLVVAVDRKSTRLNSSHNPASRMPSSA